MKPIILLCFISFFICSNFYFSGFGDAPATSTAKAAAEAEAKKKAEEEAAKAKAAAVFGDAPATSTAKAAAEAEAKKKAEEEAAKAEAVAAAKKKADEEAAVAATPSIENHLRSKKQRSKTLLQIGANDGVTNNLYVVKKVLNDAESKAILVEGSPQIFELLTKTVKTLYDETLKRIVPINAMVCEDGKQMTFYYPDIDKLREKSTEQNLEIPHWVQYQIGSLEQQNVLGGLRGWLRTMKRRGVFPKNLTVTEFVLQQSISCISLASVITQSSLAADEIGVLAVDVEGFDSPVVLESFRVPGLEPDVIVFEHKSTTTFFPEEFNTVMETLEARGYKLDCHRDPKAKGGWKCSDTNDVHAVKESSS